MASGENNICDSTENLIEQLHASRKDKRILIDPNYLDDEKLPEHERESTINCRF